MRNNNTLYKSAIASVLAHLFLILFINTVLKAPLINFDLSNNRLEKSIEVTKISPEMMKRIRTVGKKDGNEKFSMPLRKKNAVKSKDEVKIRNFGENIDLQRLRPQNIVEPTKNLPKEAKNVSKQSNFIIRQKAETLEDKVKVVSMQQQAKKIPRDKLREFGVLQDTANAIKNTEFNVSVRPPKGISEDQLNSTEKIYYAFQKRVYESYVRSFISTYRDFMRTMPYLKGRLQKEKHIMTGRVTFDKKGNIISIKMLKWSFDDNIQNIFEETLKGIRKMPNPPSDFLEGEETFVIYYQLNINAN